MFIIFYPKYTYCDSCYQDMLFTTEGKIDRNNDKFGGICFKIGGNIEDIKVWERYKFGYPFSAITVSYTHLFRELQNSSFMYYHLINFRFF